MPQIPSLGAISPQCLGVIGHIPLWTALLTVALRYGVGPLWNAYRPIWLRRFAAEQDAPTSVPADQESGLGLASRKRPWTAWTLSLLLLSLGAAALGAAGAVIWQDHAHVHLTPVVPTVRSSPPSCVLYRRR